jgi:hypothetical protein
MPTFLISGRDAQNEPAAYEIEAVDENDARNQARSLLKIIESAAPATPAPGESDTILSHDVMAQAQSTLGGKGKTLDPQYKIKRILRRIVMTCITLVIGIIVTNVFIYRNMITPAGQAVSDASIKNNTEQVFSKDKLDQALHQHYVATAYFYGLAVAGVPIIWLGVWSFAKLRSLKKAPPTPAQKPSAEETPLPA